ncbi:MAG: hypothetical protein FWC53_01770 [Firmicutes bacterium]|nr:hypothetical protein [Bacillota bacterium]
MVSRKNGQGEDKEFHTLEELIERYKELDKEAGHVKSIKLDIDAAELRIKNMKLKIKNASLYLQEIDSHTKSIFEFWRYANKDKIEELPEGEGNEGSSAKLKKTFDFALDFENFAIELDKRQRNAFSKDELNSIYIAGTEIISDLNAVAEGNEITDGRIKNLKEEILKEKMLLSDEKFDIFGSVSSDRTRINILANKKHRETKRDKIRILDIARNTDAKEYEEYLKKVLSNIHSSLEKMNLQTEISVYKSGELNEHLNIFNINANNCIDSLQLYRINLKENTPAIGFTNIVYYDNSNETLPLGMDVSQDVLIDKSLLELELKNSKKIKMVYFKDNDELADIDVKTISIEEYEVNNG